MLAGVLTSCFKCPGSVTNLRWLNFLSPCDSHSYPTTICLAPPSG